MNTVLDFVTVHSIWASVLLVAVIALVCVGFGEVVGWVFVKVISKGER